ncbi:dihydroneopterin triphosphate 2'-epimerase [uncultured Ferrimonas sp.]|uniref:dihydroneopterin triphosphate 2'-epimerase n=1 Tax=uncultured Ferrimonas sp. TaxID=432640 RepID=UPI00260CE0F9|nr:dihydroneopterin triphosphate 2'-epimerase [uncultured Ferrimonas sp.]
MQKNEAVIRIKNLRLRTFIGINDDEIRNKQDVIINATISYCADKARSSENIDDALNYRTICKSIIAHVEHQRFSLLEKLSADVLALCCDHPWVETATVEIDKPHALRFADSVSMQLSWQKS